MEKSRDLQQEIVAQGRVSHILLLPTEKKKKKRKTDVLLVVLLKANISVCPSYLVLKYMGCNYFIELGYSHLSRKVRKPVFGVSDHVRHKPVCAATADGYKLDMSDLRRRGIVLSV